MMARDLQAHSVLLVVSFESKWAACGCARRCVYVCGAAVCLQRCNGWQRHHTHARVSRLHVGAHQQPAAQHTVLQRQ